MSPKAHMVLKPSGAHLSCHGVRNSCPCPLMGPTFVTRSIPASESAAWTPRSSSWQPSKRKDVAPGAAQTAHPLWQEPNDSSSLARPVQPRAAAPSVRILAWVTAPVTRMDRQSQASSTTPTAAAKHTTDCRPSMVPAIALFGTKCSSLQNANKPAFIITTELSLYFYSTGRSASLLGSEHRFGPAQFRPRILN